MSVEVNSKERAAVAPWLSIVGLGADGSESLSPRARGAIEQAELVVGGARQLSLVAALVRGETLSWPSPLARGVEQVLARRGRSTCVLASGDPFFYGIGATLAPKLVLGEFVCFPAPSSISLAAARLGWPLQDTDVVSLHGRELTSIVRYLVPGRRVLALSWDGKTPAALAALLRARGFGRSTLHVLESLGSVNERVSTHTADALEQGDFDDLNLVGLSLESAPRSLVVGMRASLPDEAFEHDGQLTKQDVRALTLSALAPRAGALLWDVGAGSGSIAIEWMLSHPSCRAIAIEQDRVRASRIAQNAQTLGVPTLEIVHGRAPDALAGLAPPAAVFIGGGGGDEALFTRCFAALASGGRLVMNAVSLQTEALLFQLYQRHGGELRRFSIERATQLGSMTGWRPAMPIVQWRIDKP